MVKRIEVTIYTDKMYFHFWITQLYDVMSRWGLVGEENKIPFIRGGNLLLADELHMNFKVKQARKNF